MRILHMLGGGYKILLGGSRGIGRTAMFSSTFSACRQGGDGKRVKRRLVGGSGQLSGRLPVHIVLRGTARRLLPNTL